MTESESQIENRCQLIPYPSVTSATGLAESEYSLNLNGIWTFVLCSSVDSLPRAKEWHDVEVPGILDDFVGHDDSIKQGKIGIYRYRFSIKAKQLSLGQAVLRLEGLFLNVTILINGKKVADAISGFLPQDFSVQGMLKRGSNKLEIQIHDWDSKPKEAPEIPGTVCIFRPITLIFFPMGGLFDIKIGCQFDAVSSDADITVQCVFDNYALSDPVKRKVSWYLGEPNSQDIFASVDNLEIMVDSGSKPSLESKLRVRGVRPWTAEDPYLYNLIVKVSDENDRPVDIRCMPWGIRNVEIQPTPGGGVFKINGSLTKLHGIVRRDFHPHSGVFLTPEEIENDLFIIKSLNINAVHCQDYANPRLVYEIADRIGLYVICESYAGSSMQNIANTIRSFANHCSIIIWSFHSDNPGLQKIKSMSRLAKKEDITRLLYFKEDVLCRISDIDCLKKNKVKRPLLKSYFIKSRRHKIKIYYALSEKTKHQTPKISRKLERNPYYAGMFAGELTDHALYVAHHNRFRFIHRDGVISCKRKYKAVTMELKKLYSPVEIEVINWQSGLFKVTNRNSFVPFSIYNICWNIRYQKVILSEGVFVKPVIAPGSSKVIQLIRNYEPVAANESYLTCVVQLNHDTHWAAKGHEVARFQFALPDSMIKGDLESENPPELQEYEWLHEVQNDDLLVAHNNAGFRIDLRQGHVDLMDFGFGNILGMEMKIQPVMEDDLGYKVVSHDIGHSGDNLEVVFHIKTVENSATARLSMAFFKDGKIDFNLVTTGAWGSAEMMIPLQEYYQNVEWYGLGPHPVNVRQASGACIGVYSMDVRDMARDETLPDIARCGVHWVKLTDGLRGICLRAASRREKLQFAISMMQGMVHIHIKNDCGADKQVHFTLEKA